MLRFKNALEKVFVVAVAVLMISMVVEISLVGKNVTYTTRFTPPSTEKSLKNETYYTEVQMLILFISSALLILLPFLAYSIFLKTKRFFFPLWIAFMALTALALLCNVYYMTGGTVYRGYLNQIATTIVSTPGYCEESLCNKVTCARINSFKASEKMTLAYSIIDLICSLLIVVGGFLINMQRRKTNEIELIM